jgi:hypothetical protein
LVEKSEPLALAAGQIAVAGLGLSATANFQEDVLDHVGRPDFFPIDRQAQRKNTKLLQIPFHLAHR